MTLPAFAPITSARVPRLAVQSTLQAYLPAYLAQYARQSGQASNFYPGVRSWTPAIATNDHWVEDQIPNVTVVAPGILGDPEYRGNRFSGSVDMHWGVGVGILVSAGGDNPRVATLEMAEAYAACARDAILQHPKLNGDAECLRLVDERYDDIETEDTSRTLMGVALLFDVLVQGVVALGQGPRTPPADPSETPTGPAELREVHVTVEKG